MKLLLSALFFWVQFSGMAAIAGGSSDSTVLSYRMAQYRFQAASETSSEPINIEFAYPVFQGGEPVATNRLNGWLRRTALATFFVGDEVGLSRAVQLTDRKVIESLASKGTADMIQSVLRPDSASGNVMAFTLHVESQGTARSHQGIAVYAYDTRTRDSVAVQSLFKPGAEKTLADYFLEEIQKEAPGCQAIDFSWEHVTLRGPSEASLYFPFDPSQRECGDLGYLKGKKVQNLLRSPGQLLPIRKLTEVN